MQYLHDFNKSLILVDRTEARVGRVIFGSLPVTQDRRIRPDKVLRITNVRDGVREDILVRDGGWSFPRVRGKRTFVFILDENNSKMDDMMSAINSLGGNITHKDYVNFIIDSAVQGICKKHHDIVTMHYKSVVIDVRRANVAELLESIACQMYEDKTVGTYKPDWP